VSSGRRLFFIVGSPRSGTTLLQSMLMQSPGVTIPPETQFMGIIYRRRKRLGPIESDRGWDAAVNAIVARNDRAEFPITGEELRARLTAPGERSYRRLLSDWLELCGERAGADIVGEKSPAHTEYVGELAEMYPDARFVQIVRDPRDVALSHREVWKRPPLQAALRWRFDQQSLRRHRDDSRQTRFRAVRYEDLVADSEPTIRELAEFLGLTFVPDMADPSKRRETGFAAHETHKLQTLERLTTSRIGRYRGKLSHADLQIVQAVCGGEMRALGYELEQASKLAGWARAISLAPGLAVKRRAKLNARDLKLDREARLADAET